MIWDIIEYGCLGMAIFLILASSLAALAGLYDWIMR